MLIISYDSLYSYSVICNFSNFIYLGLLFFLMRLVKILSVVFIFSKYKLLVLIDLFHFFFVLTCLCSDLYFFFFVCFTDMQLWLFPCLGVSLNCLFEIFLFSHNRFCHYKFPFSNCFCYVSLIFELICLHFHLS